VRPLLLATLLLASSCKLASDSPNRWSVVSGGPYSPPILVDGETGQTWRKCGASWCGPIGKVGPAGPGLKGRCSIEIDKDIVDCSGQCAKPGNTVASELAGCLQSCLKSATNDPNRDLYE
jgi:hypothetical protein